MNPGIFTDKVSFNISGQSPLYAHINSLENQAFHRIQQDLQQAEKELQKAHLELKQTQAKRDTTPSESPNNKDIEYTKGRILEVVSGYKTGLDRDYLHRVADLIIEEGKKYGYDPLFLTALIITESSFYNWAKSNRGALGLMQIRPQTGVAMATEVQLKWRGNSTLYDPGSNIALGTYYFNKMVLRFGDLHLALEAYNHGPSRLTKYLKRGYQPKKYSRKVLANYQKILSSTI
jgi:soluble lytic murein transglycosylase